MGAIETAGRITRSHPQWLATLFGPGLRITLLFLVLLISLHAALAMATLWWGESVLFESVHLKIVFLIGLGAVTGIFSLAKASLSVVKRATTGVLGTELRREENPRIWAFVEETAHRLGAAVPQHIIAGLFPTFYVTEADVDCIGKQITGRTLYLSLPLCRILTVGELQAVVGHELGHFRGQDTALSQQFYPIYRGAEEALHALTNHYHGYRLALLPAVYALAFFLESFATSESARSRDREFLADQAGREAAGEHDLASSLVKILAFADQWETVDTAMRKALAQQQAVPNASLAFAQAARERANPALLEGLDRQQVPHPIDSHPPLSQRLAALNLSLQTVSETALQPAPTAPAIDLIPGNEQIETDLTASLNRLLVESGEIHPETAPGDAAEDAKESQG